jgi:hypothetical protein
VSFRIDSGPLITNTLLEKPFDVQIGPNSYIYRYLEIMYWNKNKNKIPYKHSTKMNVNTVFGHADCSFQICPLFIIGGTHSNHRGCLRRDPLDIWKLKK